MSYWSLTKAEGDKLAKDLGEQQRLRDQVTEAERLLASFGIVDHDLSDRSIWKLLRGITMPDKDRQRINQVIQTAQHAKHHLDNLEIVRKGERSDFLGNLYRVGDFVTWPVGSGSSSATIRIGRVSEFRNNGAVVIMPTTGRWGRDPKQVTISSTVDFIVCVTKIINTVDQG